MKEFRKKEVGPVPCGMEREGSGQPAAMVPGAFSDCFSVTLVAREWVFN